MARGSPWRGELRGDFTDPELVEPGRSSIGSTFNMLNLFNRRTVGVRYNGEYEPSCASVAS